MSYTKHIWGKGDKITSARLNNIENGIETLATNSGSSNSGGASGGDSSTSLDEVFTIVLSTPETPSEQFNNLYIL